MIVDTFQPVFVEYAPAILEPGRLYISMRYHTVLHLCACGCGEEVVTPLDPDEWQLFFDGKTVSLYPSIGNYRFPCHSHYYITKNKVRWVIDDRNNETSGVRVKRRLASFWTKIFGK